LGVDLPDTFGKDMRVLAADWAADRSAQMVGMRWEGDVLVVNTRSDRYGNAWAISDSTRDGIQSLVTAAIADGDSTDELAARLQGAYAFSDERAEMIARTEIAKADSEGAVMGWKASEVVKAKSWLTAQDDLVSDECRANEDAGIVALDWDYGDGVTAPPQHPNCRCTLLPEIIEGFDDQ
jgi:SPP1 gp7 family putative phage head morphogenesis protein